MNTTATAYTTTALNYGDYVVVDGGHTKSNRIVVYLKIKTYIILNYNYGSV